MNETISFQPIVVIVITLLFISIGIMIKTEMHEAKLTRKLEKELNIPPNSDEDLISPMSMFHSSYSLLMTIVFITFAIIILSILIFMLIIN